MDIDQERGGGVLLRVTQEEARALLDGLNVATRGESAEDLERQNLGAAATAARLRDRLAQVVV